MSHATPSHDAATAPRGRSRDRVITALFLSLGLVLGVGYLEAQEPEAAQDGGAQGDGAAQSDGAAPVDEEAAEAAYQRGVELQRAKQTDAALAAYEEALGHHPDHLGALYEIGWSYWVLGRWSDVVATWEKVLALNPEHPDVPRYIEEARAKARLTEKLADGAAGTAPEDVPRKEGTAVRLALGGDTMTGSELSLAGLPKDDGAALFSAYAETMRAADVAFLNLEGVLLDEGRSYKCPEDSDKGCYAFRSPVRYVKNLVDAGIDVVSFANNHANDYRTEGRTSTTSTLDAAGIAVAGPLDREVILDVNGTKVGVLAFATSPLGGDLRDIPLAKAMVAELAGKADLVVVSFHGGAEGKKAQHVPEGPETFMGEDRGDLRAFTHAVVDAGADLVVGHGPHVLRGMEVYKERLIAYSLGNFVTYGGFNLSGANGLTVLLEVDLAPDGRLAAGRVIPGKQIPPGGPRIDPDREAVAMIKALSAADFAGTAVTMDDEGRITP